MKWPVCNHSLILLAWVLSALAHVSLFWIVSLGVKNPLKKTIDLQVTISYKDPEAEKKSQATQASPLHMNNLVKDQKSKRQNKNQEFSRHGALRALKSPPEQEHTDQNSDVSNSNTEITIRQEPLLLNGQHVLVPYPPKARRHKIEGKVRLRLVVAQNGHVVKAEILSCPSFDLQAAALRVVQKLLFLPATDTLGFPKIAEVEHEVIFRLHGRS